MPANEEPIDLSGQVAMITGGGRGIGRATSVKLADAGASIGVASRTVAEADDTVAEIVANGGRAIAVPTDVQDEDSVAQAVRRIQEELGPIDFLANVAGQNSAIGPTWEVDPSCWRSDVTTNLIGPFLCCRAVLPSMIERKTGRIVNYASHGPLKAFPFAIAYNCSKMGLIHFTDSLAEEVRPYDITVFALSPGSVKSKLALGVVDNEAAQKYMPELLDRMQKTWLDVEVPADAALFLASGRADGLTGCFFHSTNDVRKLAARADEIVRDDLYHMRWRTEV